MKYVLLINLLFLYYATSWGQLTNNKESIEDIKNGIELIQRGSFNIGLVYLNIGLNNSNLPDSIKIKGEFYRQYAYASTNSPNLMYHQLESTFKQIEVPDSIEYFTKMRLGYMYENGKEYNKALQLHQEAYNGYIKLYRKNHPWPLLAIQNVARCLFNLKEYSKSIDILNFVCKEIKPYSYTKYIETLLDLVLHYQFAKRHEEALVKIEEILDYCEKESKQHSEEYFEALEYQYDIYLEQERYKDALESILKLIELQKEINHPDYTESLWLASNVYELMGNPETALAYLQSISELTKGTDAWYNYADNLAMTYAELGYNKEAMDTFDKIIPYYIENYGKSSHQYINLISSYIIQLKGMAENKEKIIRLSKEIISADMDSAYFSFDKSPFLSRKAHAYLNIGEYQSYQKYLKIALDTALIEFGKENVLYISLLCEYIKDCYTDVNKGIKEITRIQKELTQENTEIQCVIRETLYDLYLKIGDYTNAINIREELILFTKKYYGENSYQYIQSMATLSTLYYSLGLYNKSSYIDHKVLNANQSLFGKDSQQFNFYNILIQLRYDLNDKKRVLQDLGISNVNKNKYQFRIMNLVEEGKYEEALKCADEALPKQYSSGDSLIVLCFKSKTLELLHRIPEAVNTCQQALNIANINNLKEEYKIPNLLARLYSLNDEHQKAFQINQEEIVSEWNKYKNILGILPEYERKLFWKNINTAHMYAPNYIPSNKYSTENEYATSLYDNALRTKGLSLYTQKQFISKILKESNNEIQKLYNTYLLLRKNIDKLSESDLDTYHKTEESLVKEVNMGIGIVETIQLKNSLSDNSIAVEFIEYTTFENKIKHIAVLLKKEWKNAIIEPIEINKEGDYDKLYQTVWKLMMNYINPGDHIYFSASGILHQIPIESLPIGNGKIMSDVYHMHRLSSTRELAIKKEPIKYEKAILYGGLNYDMTDDDMLTESNKYQSDSTEIHFASRGLLEDSIRGYKWTKLSNTTQEVEYISDLMKQNKIATQVYHGNSGNEESFKAISGQGYNIVHLATHGFFYPEQEAQKKDYFQPILQMQDDLSRNLTSADLSLWRTGLVLSGGNRAWQGDSIPEQVEDGILTANEIKDMDLRNADLVVLSACQTGQGEITSEGVFGLQRAFKMAGARTIVMSLTEVDDQTTMAMMNKFYSNLMAGQSKHDAFYNAQRYIRSIKPDPKYWMGWIMLD